MKQGEKEGAKSKSKGGSKSEEQLEETRAENADEPEVTGRPAEVCGIERTRPAGKAKEKATEGKANKKAKEEVLAAKENTKR